MSIIYGLIAQKNKPLCDYSEYKGTFTTICLKTLSKCTEEKGLLTIEDTYNIFYRNNGGITFLFLCEKSYPQEAAIVCLDKTIESFFKMFQNQNDFSNYTQYSLNNQFQKNLNEIMEKYNSDSKNLDDSINSLKENLLSMHKQVISTNEIVNEILIRNKNHIYNNNNIKNKSPFYKTMKLSSANPSVKAKEYKNKKKTLEEKKTEY